VDFDVFLPHNSVDQASVEEIACKLKDEGLKPWKTKRVMPTNRSGSVFFSATDTSQTRN